MELVKLSNFRQILNATCVPTAACNLNQPWMMYTFCFQTMGDFKK